MAEFIIKTDDVLGPDERYGLFSPTQSYLHGTAFYMNKEGNEVEVSAVTSSKESGYQWNDLKYVGIVPHVTRQGLPSLRSSNFIKRKWISMDYSTRFTKYSYTLIFQALICLKNYYIYSFERVSGEQLFLLRI